MSRALMSSKWNPRGREGGSSMSRELPGIGRGCHPARLKFLFERLNTLLSASVTRGFKRRGMNNEVMDQSRSESKI